MNTQMMNTQMMNIPTMNTHKTDVIDDEFIKGLGIEVVLQDGQVVDFTIINEEDETLGDDIEDMDDDLVLSMLGE